VSDDTFERTVLSFQRRDYARAEADCRELLSARPGHAGALKLSGVIALLGGRAAEAAGFFERALAAEPDSFDVLCNLGTAYLHLGRPADAVEQYQRATTLRPKHREAQVNLASAYKALGQYDKALAALAPLAAGVPDPLLLTELASLHVLARHYAAGIRCYREAIDASPDALPARRGLAHALQLAGRMSDAVEEYRAIAGRWPQDAQAQADLGAALAKAGAAEAAIAAYRRAVAIDPADAIARAALGQLFHDRVCPWHFTMLNDEHRNACYDAAIRDAVRPGSLVLDIGTGSGLLAMMAARAGAAHVYACESVPVIAEKARQIVEANGFAERITIIPKSSLELRIGADLPRQADVLVSEIVDVLLLGEGIVRTLAHALRELVGAAARVIPRAGAIHAMLVESEPLHRHDRVGHAAEFDVSAFNEFSRYGYFSAHLRHFAHRPLSRPVEVFRFDFTRPDAAPQQRDVEFRAAESGTCHALVSWFELTLDDRQRVSGDPAAGGAHWMQAVHLWNRPRAVERGETVKVAASHDTRQVYFLTDTV